MMRANPLRIGIMVPLLALSAGAMAAEGNQPGEAELAELLEGRIAGEPVACLPGSGREALQVIDGTAFLFRQGDTLYVNRPSGVGTLNWSDLPVFHTFGSRLCERDRVELRDRSSLIPGPILLLGEFIPYRRATEARPREGG